MYNVEGCLPQQDRVLGTKNELIFYAIAATLVGAVVQVAGGSMALTLMTSLLIPPLLLLAFRIFRR